MFSSLNVIDEAEYSFYTTFQDHQYKVTASSQACPLNLNIEQTIADGEKSAGTREELLECVFLPPECEGWQEAEVKKSSLN